MHTRLVDGCPLASSDGEVGAKREPRREKRRSSKREQRARRADTQGERALDEGGKAATETAAPGRRRMSGVR